MTAYFKRIGARVGLYSTGYQWGQIAGTVKFDQPAGRTAELARRRGIEPPAKANCALPGLTPSSRVSMTQYISGGLDYNYSCG